MERSRPSPPWFVQSITALTFLILYVPLAVLVIYSFVLIDPSSGQTLFSFECYSQALQDDELRKALNMSLWVGLWSTLGASILGTATAWALDRFSFPGKQWLDALTLVPLVIPEIVMALSLLIWFVLLKFSLGSVSIILAHITFSFSYVVITVRTRLADFDHSLEEAALDLGATPTQTFWRVSFPLIWPGILSGALMAFTLSFDDFLITFFTAGVGSDTLPIKLYSMIKYGISPKINALSTLILLSTIVMVVFAFRPKKIGSRQSESLKALG